jgi:hypothetical protein
MKGSSQQNKGGVASEQTRVLSKTSLMNILLTQEPQAASAETPEPQTPQCTRCCAVRTHYLTCPTLRLPPGYRFSEDQDPERSEKP